MNNFFLPIHRYPHECVDADGPERDFEVADDSAYDVAVHPVLRESWVDGQRDDEHAAEKVCHGQRQQVVVYNFGGT